MRKLLITGASSDMGMRYIRRLAAAGERHVVWGSYRSESESLRQLAANAGGLDLRLARVDLARPAEVTAWLDGIEAGGDAPREILHLAAAKFEYVRFRDFDWDAALYQMEIQLHSFIEIARRFLPSMAADREGRIVAVLSSCTLGAPPKFMSGYIMTKYALLGLVKSIASEYGGRGVRANAVSPGMVETKFLSNIDPRQVEMDASSSPLKRHVTLDEVAAAIDYLFSEEAACCNGINLDLSGGA